MSSLFKLTWVELKLFLRDPLTVVFTFALPLLILFILNGVFGNEVTDIDLKENTWRGVGPAEYYVPAFIGLAATAIGLIALPVHLAGYRERGVLRRFRASSIPLWSILGSQALVTLLMAAVAAVMLTAASAIAYQTQALPDHPVAFLGAFLLGAGAFASLGVLLGAVLPTARAAQGAGIILFFLQEMLSGAGPPRAVLGGPMHAIGEILPLTRVIVVLQDTWLGFSLSLGAVVVSFAIVMVSAMLAVRFFRWE